MKFTTLIFFLIPLFGFAQDDITYFEHEGEKVPMMRKAADEIKSPALKNILGAQAELDAYHANYQKGEHIKQNGPINIQTLFQVIKTKDPDWNLDYYKEELAFYEAYEKRLNESDGIQSQKDWERKQFVRDSLLKAAAIQREKDRQQFIKDQEQLKKKKQ